MNMSRKNKSVQLLYNIEDLIKILCSFKTNYLNYNSFKNQISIMKGEISVNIGDYYYSATKYDFLLPSDNNNYYLISPIILQNICPLYKKYGFNYDVKKIIFNHLYSKEHLFQKLIITLSQPQKKIGITFVNPVSLNILVKWGKDLDIIGENNEGYIFLINYINLNEIPLSFFWNKLIEAYILLTKKNEYNIKDTFVKIPLIRSLTQSLCGIKNDSDFDKLLLNLLSIEEYKLKIELSGAPIIFMKNELKKKNSNTPFIRNNNKYYFMALKL